MDYSPPIALPLHQEDALQTSIRVLNLETHLSGKKRGGDPEIASFAKKTKEQVTADQESASPAKKPMWPLNEERYSYDKLNFIVSVSYPHRNSS
ncbi:hypothetical protein Q3G72_019794 [Acer saccharum]|nr:hypothetical protein Q3G72_019794 [Acer saccharum]